MISLIISDVLIRTDKFCDKVPFLSTLTNLINLIAKIVFSTLGIPSGIALKKWRNYIEDKSLWKCLLLCVPVLGNIIVYLYPPRVRTRLNELLGHPKKYDLLPTLQATKNEDFSDPQLVTDPVMKGTLSDGRLCLMIKLSHEITKEEYDKVHEQAKTGKPIHQLRKEEYDSHPKYERVLVLYQEYLNTPNRWMQLEDHNSLLPEPVFFIDYITDNEANVNREERKSFESLQALLKSGESTDRGNHKWTMVDHEKFSKL